MEEKLDPVLQWLPPPGDGQVFKGKPNPQVQAALLHRRLSGAVTGDKVMKQLAEDAFRCGLLQWRGWRRCSAKAKGVLGVLLAVLCWVVAF